MSRSAWTGDAANGLDRGIGDRRLPVVLGRDLLEHARRWRRLRRGWRRGLGRLGGRPAVVVRREAVQGLIGQADQRLAHRPRVLDELAPLGPDLVDVLVELARPLLGVAADALGLALGFLDPRVGPRARA